MDAQPLVAGRYRLEERIGSGSEGDVWRATDLELDRPVTLERAGERPDQGGYRRMRSDVENIGRLRHEHVRSLYDLATDGDQAWLVMEHVAGPSLAELIARAPLEPRRAAAVGAQIADALAEAHRGGLVHRDVQPGNVLFDRLASDTGADHVKVADFAVAPARDATPASDVFSLGSTLCAAVSGAPPSVEIPDAAGPLEPVLRQLLSAEPADRPSAEQAAALLRAVAGEEAPVPDRAPVRRRLLAPVGALLAVPLVTVVAVLVIGRGDEASTAATHAPQRATGLGDVRTADPCALIDPDAMRVFGEVEVEPDSGAFSRCDVFVELAPGSRVDVQVRFEDGSGAEPDLVEDVGVGRLVRGSDDGEECGRRLLLDDDRVVEITAERQGPAPADRCGMAEAAAQTAIAVLRRGQVPRRADPFPPNSLALLDACELPADFEIAGPGLDPSSADRGFAGWSCRWEGAGGRGARILFDRRQPLDEAGAPATTTVGGRIASVEPAGSAGNGCAVLVTHRDFLGSGGNPLVEVVTIEVSGPEPPDRLCDPATALAAAVAAALPPS